MKKRGTLNLILFMVAVCLFATSVYAYFVVGDNVQADVGLTWADLGNEVVVEVGSEFDLRLVSYDEVFLSSTATSGKVKVIKLTDNIILTDNLIIESDININFNGKYIDLNGFDLTIRHNYMSNLTLYDGSVVDNSSGVSGVMYIEVNNAQVYYDDFTDNGLISTVYDFDKVASQIEAHLDALIADYYISDIPFIFNYKHYPITFSYDSSNKSAIDNYGRITQGTSDQTATITVDIADGTNSEQFVFEDITVLGEDSDYVSAGFRAVEEYIGRFAYAYDDGENETTRFIYYNDINLLTNDHYYGLIFKYTVLDKVGVVIGKNVDVLEMYETHDYVTLRVQPCTSDGTEIGSPTDYVFYKSNIYQIALEAMQKVGNVVLIKNLTNTIPAQHKTQAMLDYIDTQIANLGFGLTVDVTFKKGVGDNKKKLTFTAVGDYQGGELTITENSEKSVYEVDLTSGKFPDPLERVDLVYTFTFTQDGISREISVETELLIYEPGGGTTGDIGLTGDDKVFYEVLSELYAQNDTIENLGTFTLPTTAMINEAKRNIEYKIVIPTQFLTKYPYAKNIFSYGEFEVVGDFTYFTILDGGFIIDDKYVPAEDVPCEIELYINSALYEKTLPLTLPGILRQTRYDVDGNSFLGEVPNANLFYYMLVHYNGYAGLSANVGAEFIRVSLVQNSTDKTLVIGGDSAVSIGDFMGLEWCKTIDEFIVKNISGFSIANFTNYIIKNNVVRLSINGCGLSADDLTSLANMPKLTYLNLSGNSIDNLDSLPILSLVREFDISGNPITSLDNINKLYSLNTITLNALATAQIEPLIELKSLKNVYLVGAVSPSASDKDTDNVWGNDGYGGEYVNILFALNESNFTKYVLLYNRNIRFYYTYGSSEYRVAKPSAWEEEAASVLEAIFYFSVARVIYLPNVLENKTGKTYSVTWTRISGNGTVTTNDNGFYTITGAGTGSIIELQASVEINGTTYKRNIKIKVN